MVPLSAVAGDYILPRVDHSDIHSHQEYIKEYATHLPHSGRSFRWAEAIPLNDTTALHLRSFTHSQLDCSAFGVH